MLKSPRLKWEVSGATREPMCTLGLGSTSSCGHGRRNWRMLKLRFASSCRRTLPYKESTSWINVSTLFTFASLHRGLGHLLNAAYYQSLGPPQILSIMWALSYPTVT